MYRWLSVAALVGVLGLLGMLLWVALGLVRDGIPVRFSPPLLASPVAVGLVSPVRLEEPFSVKVVELPISFPARLSVAVEGPVEAEVGVLRCPHCRKGTVIPVRWNLFTGAITWRCPSCGQEFGP